MPGENLLRLGRIATTHRHLALRLGLNRGRWQMWLATGDGFFSTVPTAGTLSSAWKVASGFFNNDEKADLFLYNTTSGDYRFLRAKADPVPGQQGFDTLSTGNSSWLVGAKAYSGTMNLDPFTDLLIDRNTGDFRTWLTDGAGSWSVGQTSTFSPANWDIAIGQFNNDMQTDFLRYSSSGTGWQTWHGTTSGLTQAYSGSFGASGMNVIVGEFNNQGNQDIYRYEPGGNSWAIRTGSGGDWSSQLATGTWGVSGYSQYGGHFNNNNLTDILLHNPASGARQSKRSNGSGGWTSNSGTFTADRQIYVGVLRRRHPERPASIQFDSRIGGSEALDLRGRLRASQLSGGLAVRELPVPQHIQRFLTSATGGEAQGALYFHHLSPFHNACEYDIIGRQTPARTSSTTRTAPRP